MDEHDKQECEICGEVRKLFKITEIIDGEKKVYHVCSDCKDKVGKEEQLKKGAQKFKKDISKQLESLLLKPEASEKECPNCGKSYEDIKGDLYFGCPVCVEFFAEEFKELLKNLHSNVSHEANFESEQFLEKKKENYQELIDYAVEKELFEYAAKYRDKLNELNQD